MTQPTNTLTAATRQHLLDVRDQLEELEKIAVAAGWLQSMERIGDIAKRVNLVLLMTSTGVQR